jgi:hypothetical protein
MTLDEMDKETMYEMIRANFNVDENNKVTLRGE